jgi:hypothetical protein
VRAIDCTDDRLGGVAPPGQLRREADLDLSRLAYPERYEKNAQRQNNSDQRQGFANSARLLRFSTASTLRLPLPFRLPNYRLISRLVDPRGCSKEFSLPQERS